MASIAQLQGQTYQLPVVQPQQSFQPALLQDGIEPLQGIQYVKGMTEEYYQKVAALKSFMQNAQNNLGIDVRVPDMSRPESIQLNSIFRNALADIMSQGNLLKNSQALYAMRDQRGVQYAPGVDPTATPAAALRPGGQFDERQLDPAVLEANNIIQSPSYDEREYQQKKQIAEEKRQEYRDKIKNDPGNAFHYQRQLDAITDPAQRPFRPSSMSASDRRYGRQVNAGENWIRKVANLQEGAHNSYSPDENKLTPTGKPYLVSKEFQNQRVGDRTIVEWLHDPDTNETKIVYRDKDGLVSVVDAKQNSPDVLATQLGDIPSEALIAAAERRGWYDDFEQIDRSKVLGKDYQKLRDMNIQKSEELYKKKVSEATRNLKTDLQNIKSRPWYQDDDRLQVGRFKIAKRSGNKWEIENIEEALPMGSFKTTKAAQVAYKDKKTWSNLNDLMKFLTSQGAHIDYYNSNLPEQTVPTTTQQPQEPTQTPQTGGVVNYVVNGKVYAIPVEVEQEFLKDNPSAKKQ